MTWQCGRCDQFKSLREGKPVGEMLPKHIRLCHRRSWCASADGDLFESGFDPEDTLNCLAPEDCNAPINQGPAWHRGETGFPHHPPCSCLDCQIWYYSLK